MGKRKLVEIADIIQAGLVAHLEHLDQRILHERSRLAQPSIHRPGHLFLGQGNPRFNALSTDKVVSIANGRYRNVKFLGHGFPFASRRPSRSLD